MPHFRYVVMVVLIAVFSLALITLPVPPVTSIAGLWVPPEYEADIMTGVPVILSVPLVPLLPPPMPAPSVVPPIAVITVELPLMLTVPPAPLAPPPIPAPLRPPSAYTVPPVMLILPPAPPLPPPPMPAL